MPALLSLLLAAAPVMNAGDGTSALGEVSLREGRLVIHAGARERYSSASELEVLGWAPLQVGQERLVVAWFLRRDPNVRGVVEHQSGWMSYGQTEWINHHVALLGAHGPLVVPRWVSSGLDADAVWVAPPSTVLLRRQGVVERWRFASWALEREPGEATAGPELETRLVQVLSVGDVMLGRGTARALDQVGLEAAFAGVRPLFRSADLRLGNLESCFTADESRPEGPRSFFTPRRHLGALTSLPFDALSLANNHCDEADARTSVEVLKPAGLTPLLPWRSARFTRRGVAVEVVALRALSGDEVMTAAQAKILDALTAPLRVALVHWGVEYRAEPSQEQRALASWLQGHGINVVLGSHPHVVQPTERSAAGVVAFSQGNFVFDQEGAPGVPLEVVQGQLVELRFHPRLGLTSRTLQTVIERRAVVRLR